MAQESENQTFHQNYINTLKSALNPFFEEEAVEACIVLSRIRGHNSAMVITSGKEGTLERAQRLAELTAWFVQLVETGAGVCRDG